MSNKIKYRDEIDVDADVDEESEEEILRVHESRKQRAERLARETAERVKTQPKFRTMCCRYFLFVLVVGILTTTLLFRAAAAATDGEAAGAVGELVVG